MSHSPELTDLYASVTLEPNLSKSLELLLNGMLNLIEAAIVDDAHDILEVTHAVAELRAAIPDLVHAVVTDK